MLLQSLEGWRAEVLGDHQLTVESCDNREQDVRNGLQARIDAEDKRLSRLTERIINAMRGFKEAFKAETPRSIISLAPSPSSERLMKDLQHDDLPRFEARFQGTAQRQYHQRDRQFQRPARARA